MYIRRKFGNAANSNRIKSSDDAVYKIQRNHSGEAGYLANKTEPRDQASNYQSGFRDEAEYF